MPNKQAAHADISIHAPSRERLIVKKIIFLASHFNPRSLAGATADRFIMQRDQTFQSTLPHGSDADGALYHGRDGISIHAPLRERRTFSHYDYSPFYFNPCSLAGATGRAACNWMGDNNFNPRSLAGATSPDGQYVVNDYISIHAPSRERQLQTLHIVANLAFQSTLPHGSDQQLRLLGAQGRHFNPRSLTRATPTNRMPSFVAIFQSTLPYESDTD